MLAALKTTVTQIRKITFAVRKVSDVPTLKIHIFGGYFFWSRDQQAQRAPQAPPASERHSRSHCTVVKSLPVGTALSVQRSWNTGTGFRLMDT